MKRKELQGNLFPVNTTSAFNNKTKVRGDDAEMLKRQRDNSNNSKILIKLSARGNMGEADKKVF